MTEAAERSRWRPYIDVVSELKGIEAGGGFLAAANKRFMRLTEKFLGYCESGRIEIEFLIPHRGGTFFGLWENVMHKSAI